VIQLKILDGKKAGAEWVARRFPVRIGRVAPSDLCLEEEGIWDQHLRIDLRRGQGLVLTTAPEAYVTVNGERVESTRLRNGDTITLGRVRLLFGLGPTRQRSLRLREVLTWLALAALCIGQVALIYWLVGY
jgi:pSer/pThr/pTyr-binding forkhead associated (FHA) protein